MPDSWKLVRDLNEDFCRANGVSGQWRTSPDPASALLRKIFEEAGEYAEHRDPGELYDLLDVVQTLIDLTDSDLEAHYAHQAKVARMGGFVDLVEWNPVPPAEPLAAAGPRDPVKILADLHRDFVMRLRAAAPTSAYARKLLASVDPDGGLS